MKKILENKIDKIALSMMIIILLELIIIIITCKMSDLAALATIASAILIYLTLRETSNSNKKQLEMQTKIALYEKRMKFREELIAFANNHAAHIADAFESKYKKLKPIQELHNQIHNFFLTTKDIKLWKEVRRRQKETLQNIKQLWKQIEKEKLLYDTITCDDFSFKEPNTAQLLLDAKLLFNDSEIITDYIKGVYKRLASFYQLSYYNLNPSAIELRNAMNDTLYFRYKWHNSLMQYMNYEYLEGVYPNIQDVRLMRLKEKYKLSEDEENLLKYKEGQSNRRLPDLTFILIQNINHLSYASRGLYDVIPSEWKDGLQVNLKFEEVDKVIQEEAKLLS